ARRPRAARAGCCWRCGSWRPTATAPSLEDLRAAPVSLAEVGEGEQRGLLLLDHGAVNGDGGGDDAADQVGLAQVFAVDQHHEQVEQALVQAGQRLEQMPRRVVDAFFLLAHVCTLPLSPGRTPRRVILASNRRISETLASRVSRITIGASVVEGFQTTGTFGGALLAVHVQRQALLQVLLGPDAVDTLLRLAEAAVRPLHPVTRRPQRLVVQEHQRPPPRPA